jgi:choline dehydrogenase-like flavoprotein
VFLDARELPDATTISAEVCIVGAGAAGIALARELSGAPFRVCLLESGGFDYEADTQGLYAGRNIGVPYGELDATRLRYFGGTTNHWGGWCRPLDPIDFERRDWIPHSGWPFGVQELDPFYRRAQDVCQLGSYGYDAEFLERAESHNRLLPLDHERVVTIAWQFSPPTRFGEVYRHDLATAPNVSVYLHANVVTIEANDDASSVTSLKVATLAGSRFVVEPQILVLAAGGIENARLLLVSNDREAAGLGNRHDLVGRFFMEHPSFYSGVILPAEPDRRIWKVYLSDWASFETGPRPDVYGGLSLPSAVQEKERLLGYSASLHTVPQARPDGWEALKRLLGPIRGGEFSADFMSDLRQVLSDLGEIVSTAYHRLDSEPPVEMLEIHNAAQQAPNPHSRILLDEQERDALGLPRVKLDWRLTELDKYSIRRSQEILANEFGRAGVGRLKIELSGDDSTWPSDLYYGNHYIGTTRMSDVPTQGVVDRNCCVHGMSNLYLAGSSVFPTSGYAPPTLTIVALALRLADHIKKALA